MKLSTSPSSAINSSGGDGIVVSNHGSGNNIINVEGTVTGGNYGISATSQGAGNITIDTSGSITGLGARGIWAVQGASGLGGVEVTGTGSVTGLGSLCLAGNLPLPPGPVSPRQGCSAIRAEIENPADTNNVTISFSGNASGTSDALNGITYGPGNVSVSAGVNATLNGTSEFGIHGASYGTGSVSLSTSAGTVVTSNGAGVYAVNLADAIPAAANSTITVTTNGTITSGTRPNSARTPLSGAPAGVGAAYGGSSLNTPLPNVYGTINVINNAVIYASGGNGIAAVNLGNGNVSVTSTAPITVTGATSQNGIEALIAEAGNISIVNSNGIAASNGNGIQTSSAAGGTTINVIAGTTQGATAGINAAAAGGAVQIYNSGTIQNMSGLANDLAIATSGTGNAIVTNNAGATLTGTVSMSGVSANSFINAGIWNTLGVSTFAGASNIINSGIINVLGPTTFNGLTSLSNSGILNLSGSSGTVTTLTVVGSLAFTSGALYAVQVASASSSTNVLGSAALAGTVEAVIGSGTIVKTYDILHAANLGGTTFGGAVSSAPGLIATLSYGATDVFLNLTAALGSDGGLTVNQQNVATALNNFFNSGGALSVNFVNVFGLTGSNLDNALTQLDGEVAADSQFAAFQMTNEFLNLMLDPFVDGRLGIGGVSGLAMSFAPDAETSLPADVALAYASILKAPPPAPFTQRWTAWGASYGGGDWTNGNAAVGSSSVNVQTFGFVGGMDYHYSPDAIFGFALAGGGANWSLSAGLGSGHSDAFQTGVYGITRSGPAYLAAALSFTNHWITTTRAAMGDELTASFAAQSYGARLEGGYRLAAPSTGLGLTPYAALQAQDFYTPAYSESDVTGGPFGLSYHAVNATDTRTELGTRFDDPAVVGGIPLLLRARLAWAHDFVGNPAIRAVFQSQPGASFTVNGAPIPQNSALTSASAELYITPHVTFVAKLDGEFAPGSQTYAGSGTFRYSW